MLDKEYYKKLTNNFTDFTKINLDSEEYMEYKFITAIQTFKKLYLKNMQYEEFVVEKYKIVFLIEDSLVVIFYVYEGDNSKFVAAEELLYNGLFKFSKEIFWKNCIHPMTNQNFNIRYFDYTGNIKDDKVILYSHDKIENKFCPFEYVDKKIPELKMHERYNLWKGWEVNFICYELEFENKKGYAIEYTLEKNPLKYAVKREKNLEVMSFAYQPVDKLIPYQCSEKLEKQIRKVYTDCIGVRNLLIHKKFCDLAHEIMQKAFNTSDKDIHGEKIIFSKRLNYWIETHYIKDMTEIMYIERSILDRIIEDDNSSIEKMKFKITEYKWKSEELMVECIKKVFPENEIIRQHTPFFLRTDKGQMSYDAFVLGKNIAFEYQGKQHFEPIEYFGGKESFIKQQDRDKLKKEISEKNGIRLIYINYNENISTDLIRKKIENQK